MADGIVWEIGILSVAFCLLINILLFFIYNTNCNQMQKLSIIHQEDLNKRNPTVNKNIRKSMIEELGQLPHLPIQEVKTVKMITKKSSKVPFLNLADLKPTDRPKVTSLKHHDYQKLATERKATHGSSQDVSFFLQECDLLITKKNPSLLKQTSKNQMRKSSLLPPITQCGQSTPIKPTKRIENRQNSNDIKRKGLRMKVQCKVLLAKHNDFPFIGSNIYEHKRIERMRTKQSSNPQNIDLFDLDISRISEVDELPKLNFISQESFKQIPIF